MKSPKYQNIKVDEISDRRIFILLHLKSVQNLPNVVYYDELGKRINHQYKSQNQKNAFVSLYRKCSLRFSLHTGF